MVFQWSLSDSKFPRVSRTPLSILTDLNNAVVWISSTGPLMSKSSSLFIKPLRNVPSAPFNTSITVTFMFHSFFCSLTRSQYSLFAFVYFYPMANWDDKDPYSARSLFFSTWSHITVENVLRNTAQKM